MADVFISYSREDRDWVQMLATALEAERLWVWWDYVLRPGENYRKAIDEELAAAKVAIAVWSRNSIESDWVISEANDARTRGVLVSILKEDVLPPREFRNRHVADLSKWQGHLGDEEFRGLVNAIRSMAGRAPAATPRMTENNRTEAPSNSNSLQAQRRAERPVEPRQARIRTSGPAVQNDDIIDKPDHIDGGSTIRTNPIFYLFGAVALAGALWLGFRLLSPTASSSGMDGSAAAGPNPIIAIAEKAAENARQIAKQADAMGDEALAQYKTAVSLAASSTPLPPEANSKYSGQANGTQPQGLGEKVYDPLPPNCTAQTFEGNAAPHAAGQWDRGKMSGLGVQTNCKGFIYKGQFADGRPEGLGISIGPDGTTYRGQFGTVTRDGRTIDHQPTVGVRTFIAPNFAREEAGTMGDRGLDGPGVIVCENGDRWEASWTNGARNGYARKIDANGKVLQEGTFTPDAAANSADPTNEKLCSP